MFVQLVGVHLHSEVANYHEHPELGIAHSHAVMHVVQSFTLDHAEDHDDDSAHADVSLFDTALKVELSDLGAVAAVSHTVRVVADFQWYYYRLSTGVPANTNQLHFWRPPLRAPPVSA